MEMNSKSLRFLIALMLSASACSSNDVKDIDKSDMVALYDTSIGPPTLRLPSPLSKEQAIEMCKELVSSKKINLNHYKIEISGPTVDPKSDSGEQSWLVRFFDMDNTSLQKEYLCRVELLTASTEMLSPP
jgi:hypothetical protein